jgi:DNA polymerase III epsilon subunit-like protein
MRVFQCQNISKDKDDLIIVMDLEMSGLDPMKNSILSIGAVDFSKPKNQFYMECRLMEGADADPEALKVNGFTKKGIADKKKESNEIVIKKFCKWMDAVNDRTIAGHNVQFDMRFLKHAFYVYKMDYKIGSRCIDTYALAYVHHLKRRAKPPMKDNRADITSDVVFKYCGLTKEPYPHNALMGAKMEAESISRMMYGKPLLREFKEFEIPRYLVPKK